MTGVWRGGPVVAVVAVLLVGMGCSPPDEEPVSLPSTSVVSEGDLLAEVQAETVVRLRPAGVVFTDLGERLPDDVGADVGKSWSFTAPGDSSVLAAVDELVAGAEADGWVGVEPLAPGPVGVITGVWAKGLMELRVRVYLEASFAALGGAVSTPTVEIDLVIPGYEDPA